MRVPMGGGESPPWDPHKMLYIYYLAWVFGKSLTLVALLALTSIIKTEATISNNDLEQTNKKAQCTKMR
jgi:hypothetical protein